MMHSLASRFKVGGGKGSVEGRNARSAAVAERNHSNGNSAKTSVAHADETAAEVRMRLQCEKSPANHSKNISNNKISALPLNGLPASSSGVGVSPARPAPPASVARRLIARPPRLVPAEEIDHDSPEGRQQFYIHLCFLLSKKLGVTV